MNVTEAPSYNAEVTMRRDAVYRCIINGNNCITAGNHKRLSRFLAGDSIGSIRAAVSDIERICHFDISTCDILSGYSFSLRISTGSRIRNQQQFR